jgi:large subunit ribosomal protein L22
MSKKPNPPRVAENEARAFVKHLRISPQKLNLVAEMIRGMQVEKALVALDFSHKRIAQDVHKVLSSAIANAENNHQLDVDRLIVSRATVGKQMVIKRIRARARGRAGKIVKPFSNLTIVVRETEDEVEAA